jgi:hypothetical protein
MERFECGGEERKTGEQDIRHVGVDFVFLSSPRYSLLRVAAGRHQCSFRAGSTPDYRKSAIAECYILHLLVFTCTFAMLFYLVDICVACE